MLTQLIICVGIGWNDHVCVVFSSNEPITNNNVHFGQFVTIALKKRMYCSSPGCHVPQNVDIAGTKIKS